MRGRLAGAARVAGQVAALSALIAALAWAPAARAQNRIGTAGAIGWYNAFAGVKVAGPWGAHLEYQFRRYDVIVDWQQSLLRLGPQLQVTPALLLRVGYAWVETFPYGEIPLNPLGREFTEHRIFEMAQLGHREGIVELTHRYMLEQRFVGRYSSAEALTEDDFPLTHRARYMLRAQVALRNGDAVVHMPYVAAYDEILIGFGSNIGANVFDQNRLGILAGYQLDPRFRAEAGYINQILQFGRTIDGMDVFQYNQGIIVNVYFTLDLRPATPAP